MSPITKTIIESRRCSKCKSDKALSEFHAKPSSWCKQCCKDTNLAYRRTEKGLLRKIYACQKNASKERGHPKPSYTFEELVEWVKNQGNFEGLYKRWVRSGYKKELIPSIDRKDDYKGYSFDNLLRICTWRENHLRGLYDRKHGINNKSNVGVASFTVDGKLVKKYHSIHEASRQTGYTDNSIYKAARKMIAKCGGLVWEYTDESKKKEYPKPDTREYMRNYMGKYRKRDDNKAYMHEYWQKYYPLQKARAKQDQISSLNETLEFLKKSL